MNARVEAADFAAQVKAVVFVKRALPFLLIGPCRFVLTDFANNRARFAGYVAPWPPHLTEPPFFLLFRSRENSYGAPRGVCLAHVQTAAPFATAAVHSIRQSEHRASPAWARNCG